ncbi:hypothetical protein C8J57DRAFT_1705003 [Mycena rebaudengoi]|nr:hypothetical protein C8J57DRAFT_1705003 [Mycena rebaudengoi]
MHRADDALATPDPHDTLSTSASHGALAWSDPRDTLHARPAPPRCAVSLVLSTTTCSPRLTARSPRLTARIHAENSVRQHVKARKGVPQGRAREERLPASDSSTRGESSDSACGLISTRIGAACSHRAQSAGARARNDSRTRLEPRAASLWLAYWHAACRVSSDSLAANRARDACTQLVPSRVARAAVCRRLHSCASLIRIGLTLLVGNARAVSIM